MSIGHGYYIEDGTETDNKLYSNIGILARAAVDNAQNPRKVPGILSAAFTDRQHNSPYHSDTDNPTVFWIMNGWNDFRYNFAAGAGSLRRLLLARAGLQQRAGEHATSATTPRPGA